MLKRQLVLVAINAWRAAAPAAARSCSRRDGHLLIGVHVEPLVRARQHRQYEHRDFRAPQDIPKR